MTSLCAGCGSQIEMEVTGLCAACAGGLMRQKLSYLPPVKTIEQEDDQMADSQKNKILRHLEIYGSIDPVQALQEYGIFRLAARIDELRREAYDIDTHLVSTINRFGDEVRYGRYVMRRPAGREV